MSKQQTKRTLQITIDSELLDDFQNYKTAVEAFEEFTGSTLHWHELNLRDEELYSKIELFENFLITLIRRPKLSGDFTFELSPEEQEKYGIDKYSYQDVEGYICKELILDLDLRKSIIETLGLMGLIDLTRIKEEVEEEDFEELLSHLVPQELITYLKTHYPYTDIKNREAMMTAIYNYRGPINTDNA